MKNKKGFWLFFLLTIMTGHATTAQRSTQLWADYELHFPFASDYEFIAEGSYQTVLADDNKWRSYNFTPTLEWGAFAIADIFAEIPLAYTVQHDTFNTTEVRLTLGVTFYVTANKRIESRAIIRAENRYLNDKSDEPWQKSSRLRFRGLVMTAINRKTHYEDKLWYAIADGEVFYVLNDDVTERFANRLKVSLGLGYRLNYNFRFELFYSAQQSRNALDENGFVSDDSIIRFRYKHYINKAKPKTTISSQ